MKWKPWTWVDAAYETIQSIKLHPTIITLPEAPAKGQNHTSFMSVAIRYPNIPLHLAQEKNTFAAGKYFLFKAAFIFKALNSTILNSAWGYFVW